MLKRKTPLRMCVGCQEMKSKKELLRVVRTPLDEIVLDTTVVIPISSAYNRRPGEFHAKIPFDSISFQLVSFAVYNNGLYSRKR